MAFWFTFYHLMFKRLTTTTQGLSTTHAIAFNIFLVLQGYWSSCQIAHLIKHILFLSILFLISSSHFFLQIIELVLYLLTCFTKFSYNLFLSCNLESVSTFSSIYIKFPCLTILKILLIITKTDECFVWPPLFSQLYQDAYMTFLVHFPLINL